ncbi:MAG: FecR domain-containing protein [Proteobacteria bacterium]|nr:FecR domain-containing protein [Pseudomonadota bacterium]
MTSTLARSLIALVALCFAIAGPAAAQDSEKEIGYVSQKAFLGAKGHRVTGESEDLKYRTEVWSNETVRTGAQGMTNLRFLDKTKLQVSSSSEVVLDRFVYDDDSDTGEMAMTFTKVAFRFITGRMSNKDGFKLRTPTVAIGIRGTDFKVRVASDGTTTVSVLEGEVEVTPLGGGRGASIGEGQSAIGTATGVAASAGDAVGSGINMESNRY